MIPLLHKGVKIIDTKILRTLFSVSMVILVLIFAIDGQETLAFVNENDRCGLTVKASESLVDTRNLNPGDRKVSYLVVSNQKDTYLEYWLDIQVLDRTSGHYPGLVGAYVDDILEITVERNGIVLFQGRVSEFEELKVGILPRNSSERLDVFIYLPGPETDNKYQGASSVISFSLRSVCYDSSIPPPPPTDDPDDEDEIIEIDDELPPAGRPEVPPTWEMPPYVFYSVGFLMILVGYLLNKKQS